MVAGCNSSMVSVEVPPGPPVLSTLIAEVYGPEMVGPNQLRQNGAARYVGSVDDAKKDPRVGASPLVVKATGLGAGGSDIMISAEDAAKLQGVNLAFMAEGRVVIATDSP